MANSFGPLTDELAIANIPTQVVPFPDRVARLGDGGVSTKFNVRQTERLIRASPLIFSYARRMRAVLGYLSPDVVHTNGLKMHGVGALAAPSSAKLLWHMHDYASRRPIMSRILRTVARRCSVAIGNSYSVSNDLRSVCGNRLEVRTIHNGTDLQRFNPVGPTLDLDRLCKLPPAPFSTVKVGLVATMAPWKGHEVFLRAIAMLPKELPVRAYLIGGAIYETAGIQRSVLALRQLAHSLGIGNRVGFTAYISEVPAAMRALDVVVHASTSPEPFGMVIIEAMACGRALVVSNAGGATEIAGDGTFAILHSPGNVAELAHAIRVLVETPALRESFGKEARRRAEILFDRLLFARSFADAYSRIAGNAVQ